MPAETPGISDPAEWDDDRIKPEWHETIRAHLPLFDPQTTPTTMGAIAEAFRTFPGTVRSNHPQVSVCAHGRHAQEIVSEHALAFCEGRGTPFEKLYDLGAWTMLLGVGFNRCTSLHYAESLVPQRRTAKSRYPWLVAGRRRWVENEDMASDRGTHFPAAGAAFMETGQVRRATVGGAETKFFETTRLVDFAEGYFSRVLSGGAKGASTPAPAKRGRFRPRPTRFVGVSTLNGWRLKRYEITLDDQPIAADINAAVDTTFAQALPAVPPGELGVGFLVIHHGKASVWVLADLWTGDIISQHTFSASLDAPTALAPVPAGGPTACVWELVVHGHERNAFVKHVLDPPSGPDVDGYLADTL